MNGKKYLDKKYGLPRGNGKGISKILDDFAEAKINEEIIPTLELIKERAKVPYVELLAQELIDKYNSKEK